MSRTLTLSSDGRTNRSIRVTVPLMTFETNTWAIGPRSLIVRSQTPWSSLGSVSLSTWWPKRSITWSDPGPMFASVPSGVGALPTITKPPFRTPSAVERPGSVDVKKTDCCPWGVIRTMVVPVPCTLRLLLKFETRTSPG